MYHKVRSMLNLGFFHVFSTSDETHQVQSDGFHRFSPFFCSEKLGDLVVKSQLQTTRRSHWGAVPLISAHVTIDTLW